MVVPDYYMQDGRCDDRSSTAPPLAINRILALYPRERLLVHPFRWTNRQLDLLQYRFHLHGDSGDAGSYISAPELAHQASKAATPSLDHPNGRAARRLACARRLAPRLKNVTGGPFVFDPKRTVHLYFNQRPYVRLPYCHMSFPNLNPVEDITIASFALREVGLNRIMSFRTSNSFGYSDWPGVYRSEILEKRFFPADRNEDPYLVALIIALAQNQRRRYTAQTPPPCSFTIRLLVAAKTYPTPFNLYVAHVQSSFLDRFDFPNQNPPVHSGLDIYYRRILAEPFKTLPERLDRAIRLDCCGKIRGACIANQIHGGLGKKCK